MPLRDPKGWMFEYYLRYPALTIFFYPPLLHVALGIFFLVFGVSHRVAVACVGSFVVVLMFAVYALVRRNCTAPASFCAAVLALAAPEVLTWGRQIMLEIPMLAFMGWSAYFFLRYLEDTKPPHLFFSSILLVCACYTKQTAIILLLSYAIAVLSFLGPRRFLQRHVWVIVTLCAIALLPLALMQLYFGAFNVVSVIDRPDIGIDRFSVEGLTWYLTRLPVMFGFAVPLAVAGLLLRATKDGDSTLRQDLCVHAYWLVVGYAFLSAISLKEQRHGLILLIPVTVFAGWGIDRLATRWFPAPIRALAIALLSVIGLGTMMAIFPTPAVIGYAEAADYVVREAPPNARIMFVGNRDGAFIFNIRSHETRGSRGGRGTGAFGGKPNVAMGGWHARDPLRGVVLA